MDIETAINGVILGIGFAIGAGTVEGIRAYLKHKREEEWLRRYQK